MRNAAFGMNRRGFLRSTAVLGSGLLAATPAAAQSAAPAPGAEKELLVGMIGLGTQGQNLLTSIVQIPGVRIKALCDIWTTYNQKESSDALDACNVEHANYADWREMLDKEKGLDAVIIATPDHRHAEQATACLQAGRHVYCETPMAHTLDAARQMVAAARASGKLLQIGLQRRSNPRYIHCCENLLREVNLLGRITAVNGQWNRPVQPDRGWPRRFALEDAALAPHGYKSMQQFRNWQWYADLSGGPLLACGTHQVDVFNWFLGAPPKSVVATGGVEFYDKKTHECYDTVLAVFEYETKQGPVRASYQVVMSNGNLGAYEKFLGAEGTMLLSEEKGLADVFREDGAPEWERWVNLDLLARSGDGAPEAGDDTSAALNVVKSVQPSLYHLPVAFEEPLHKPHLANFFNAARGREKLRCPAEEAFPATVAVFKALEAARTGRKVEITADDLKA